MQISNFKDMKIIDTTVLDNNRVNKPFQSLAVIGQSLISGYFVLEINLYSNVTIGDGDDDDFEYPSLSYWSSQSTPTASSAVDKFKQETMDFMSKRHGRTSTGSLVYDDDLDLLNTGIGKSAGNIVFQIRATNVFQLETILHENLQFKDINELEKHVLEMNRYSDVFLYIKVIIVSCSSLLSYCF